MTTFDTLTKYVKEKGLEYYYYNEGLNKHYLLPTDPIDKSRVFWYIKEIGHNKIYYYAYES